MAKRDVELALESPQLVEAFNFEMKVIVRHGYFDHPSASIFKALEIETYDGMIGDDSGKLPALLAQLIQLLLVRRFLLRQIAGEGFVLPHSLVFHIDHRRDRRGGRTGKIESGAHVASSQRLSTIRLRHGYA